MDDLEKIYAAIPQRPPFLFIEKIVEQKEKFIHTQKKITGSEDFFKGHFPDNPIMPGVLMMEAAFQSAGIIIKSIKEHGLGVITKVDNTRFRHLVRPGDILDIKIDLTKHLKNLYFFDGKLSVSDKSVMTLSFVCAVLEN
ncbi:MAG: 3-hydroxyacyl-ACP dehydratase FabZ [Halobacteriovoraceae bacterium]|nr:3-hydroxyacyl-ACP dehydratase FabZ [Halobacteriovoraceae bacterium]